jgi:drug/metabolite transporter (DMT)-like permease
MALSAILFAANVLLVRAMSVHGFSNIWLVSCARFVVGLVIIATVYRREWEPMHLIRNRKLIERGLTGGLGVYVTYLAVVKIGAGRAVFINNTYVIWGALAAAWLLRERLRPVVLVGGAAGLAGLGLLTHVFSAGARPALYDGVAVLSALLSAYVVVTIRQLHASEHSSTIFSAQCVYGLVICTVPAVLSFQFPTPIVLLLLGLASICAGIGQLAMTRAFRELSVAEGSLLQMLVPIGTAVGGAVFFGEHFRPSELIGGALVLAGSTLPALWRTRSRDAVID